MHAYDDERIMAGQGTATLELIEDGGALDLLLVPVGGGGLIAGAVDGGDRAVPRLPRRRRRARVRRRHARSLAAGERVVVPVGARSPTASSSTRRASARSP